MDEKDIPRTNIPEYSVSELAGGLKRTLEEAYGHVRVRGELSRVSVAASGHMYSTLKDAQAAIDAVCWRGTLSKLSVKPEEGLEVVCTGRITTYPARSNYQLIIDLMELAGAGALLKLLEERKKRLAAEGLFDAARKKKLPFLPGVIGVVTSPTGAVIRDILHRLEDRMPRHVIVWPVLVQGAGAAEAVAAAVNGFQTIHEHGLPRPDLLIVARGGGSLEDLMPFNEEIVARAVAASSIPIISAVGHETDTTLCDYAADVRAPTPTGAAEMAVPVRVQLLAQVLDTQRRLYTGLSRLIDHARQRLETQKQGLKDPSRLLEMKMQALDHVAERLRLRRPEKQLEEAQKTLERFVYGLVKTMPRILSDLQRKTDHMEQVLRAYSFENVLERGFAVARGVDGKLVTEAGQTKVGDLLEIQFKKRGFVRARVEKSK
ncbi:MAG: exodeoxyribonuclease VII large subunit [Alphaproteobacteria bacterium]